MLLILALGVQPNQLAAFDDCLACFQRLGVVDAMVKVMESMPSAQREQFRERVVQISRARILQLDRESRNENGWVSIENAVKKDSFNSALKIV